MIKINNVSKYFGETCAISNVSLEINEGEKMVLLGTSGCGKTTLLKLINRLIEPSVGNILINSISILDQNPQVLRRGIGYVLQHNGLFPHYTIEENIAVVPKLLNWDESKIKSRIHSLLEKLNLPSDKYLKLFPSQLSGGQQQRVGLARALAADPQILLMDEPFSALDPLTRSSIKKELLNLDEFNNKTVLIVTHDVEEAFEMADRICLMDKGKIVQIDSPTNLLYNPENDFVKSFFNSQRLTLEFKSIKLEKIFNFLPDTGNSVEEIQTISSNINVWMAMELLNENEHIFIKEEISGKIKKVNMNDIMNAFIENKK